MKNSTPIYTNAIDSLRIGMEYFRQQSSYSSRKHAILTVFHAMELLLKERLAQTSPILIYRNIDKKITHDSPTIGVREALVRFDNLGVPFPKEHRDTIESIQRIRNRIEHHQYDHEAKSDEAIIAASLKFILYFIEFTLQRKPSADIEATLLRDITKRVLEYDEQSVLAEHRIEKWLSETWPNWNQSIEDTPEEFEGTLPCPECSQEWLVIKDVQEPFCFWCGTSIDAVECHDCGLVFRSDQKCNCSTTGDEQ